MGARMYARGQGTTSMCQWAATVHTADGGLGGLRCVRNEWAEWWRMGMHSLLRVIFVRFVSPS